MSLLQNGLDFEDRLKALSIEDSIFSRRHETLPFVTGRLRPPQLAPAAFTLIEVLVGILIIGILLSLLFPALTRVRQKARLTISINNLRQIGQGLKMYADDHGGYPRSLSTNAAGKPSITR
jgi:prepilin-type N-terminal cleavage/methylation domain-containing protein